MDFPDIDSHQRRSSDGMLIQCKNCRDRRRPSRVHGHCQVCRRKVCPDCKQLNKKAALMNCNKMLNDPEANSLEFTSGRVTEPKNCLDKHRHSDSDLVRDRDTGAKYKPTYVTSGKTTHTHGRTDLIQPKHNLVTSSTTNRLFATDKKAGGRTFVQHDPAQFETTIAWVPKTTSISKQQKLFRSMSTQTPRIKKFERLPVDKDSGEDSPDGMQNHNVTLVDKATDVKTDGFHEHCRHHKQSACYKSCWSEESADSTSPENQDLRDQATDQSEPITYPASSDTPTQTGDAHSTDSEQRQSPAALQDTSEKNLAEANVCSCSKHKHHSKRKHKRSTKCTRCHHIEDDRSTRFCKPGSEDNAKQTNAGKFDETLDRNPADQHQLKSQTSEVGKQGTNPALVDVTTSDPKSSLVKPNTGSSPERSTSHAHRDSHRHKHKSKRTSLKTSVIIEDTTSTNMATKVEVFRVNSKTKQTKVIHAIKELQPESQTDNILVKSDNDNEECDISGMALLSVDELVLADKGNNKLKVVDLARKELTVEIVLRVGVRSVCAVPGRRFGVTVPERNIIKLLALQDDKVVQDRDIECEGCDGYCCGLAYNDGSFIVSFIDPSVIQVIKLSGQTIHTFPMIPKVTKSLKTFQTPQYISVWEENEGDNTSVVYVSDTSAQTVIKTDSTGNVTDVFRFPDKWFPLSVQATTGDEFLVCSSSHSSVCKIKDNGDHVLAETIIMVDKPKLLCYCSDKQVMYVTMPKYSIAGEICNYVKIYPVEDL